MSSRDHILVSWIAQNNDPVDSRRGDDGPTLTLLFHATSPYRDKVRVLVLLYREHGEDTVKERDALEATEAAIRKRDPSIRLHREAWHAPDPTDHQAIYAFLAPKLGELRRQFVDERLIIHVSPGTGSMQTVWVLMGETGLIDEPFTLVKSYRDRERGDRPAIVPVRVGLESYYKAYLRSSPQEVNTSEQALRWDPKDFRGETLPRLFREAHRFATLKVPVLLLGERGTGKSTFASWIRAHSPYRRAALDRNWPAVTCGQYSPHTMRSELFGHEKGAFTDAGAQRQGQLARADGDTLFLDEVGDVSRELQRLLIKALEERRYQPLGSDVSKSSDFRLICATNLPDAELRARLDPDFLDRISPLTLSLPPLREISEELVWMWPKVFSEAARRAEAQSAVPLLGLAEHAQVVEALRRAPLPGNLRDLFRVAYRVLAGLEDPNERLAPSVAVDYGLEILARDASGAHEASARLLARAFAEGQSLDHFFAYDDPTPLPTKAVLPEFKRYLGVELRRIAAARGLKAEQLCDTSERTLLNWIRDEVDEAKSSRKKSSNVQKKKVTS